jgi:hypothetical protein
MAFDLAVVTVDFGVKCAVAVWPTVGEDDGPASLARSADAAPIPTTRSSPITAAAIVYARDQPDVGNRKTSETIDD